ncbi:LINE-1 retrotransposable element ORF1 protein [Plecturocebus cupreus]
MGRNQCKKDENTRNQNTSPPTRDHNSSPAREQGWTETECEEMTESGFRRWVIRNFCELKEHVLTQCKETKNFVKRFEEMLTRMDNLERTISELMELKNTTRELSEACTSFNSRIDQAEERVSEANIQVQEIQRTPQRYSSRRATPRHIIVRFTRVEMKEKNAKQPERRVGLPTKEVHQTHSRPLSRNPTSQKRVGPIFNILKEKNFQPRISYPAKLSFISEGKIKSFVNQQVLRDFITTRPALQELLKEALHIERNNQYQPLQKHNK